MRSGRLKFYFDGREVNSNEVLTPSEVDGNLDLNIHPNGNGNELSTVIILDESAPFPNDPYNAPYLHYLLVNVKGSDLSTGVELIPYLPASPQSLRNGDIPVHEYSVYLLRQQYPIRAVRHKRRENFDVEKYAQNEDLEQVDVLRFGVGEPAEEVISDYDRPLQKSDHFKSNRLSDGEQSHCSCVLHVAAKQPKACLRDQAWGQKREGKTCYNPYAVCGSAGTRPGRSGCDVSFDLPRLSTSELVTLANLKRIELPDNIRRDEIINIIETHIAEKKEYSRSSNNSNNNKR